MDAIEIPAWIPPSWDLALFVCCWTTSSCWTTMQLLKRTAFFSLPWWKWCSSDTSQIKPPCVLDLPCMCTKHGLNRGSYSEKAPVMLHEGEAPPLRGCCHACCGLPSGGEWQTFRGFTLCGCHTDLPQEAAQGRKLPCKIAICGTGTIREEKFGLGWENRWKAALLLWAEVNTSLFKMHLFS